jgi:phosphoenolpyruvate carboxykinase (ATP)
MNPLTVSKVLEKENSSAWISNALNDFLETHEHVLNPSRRTLIRDVVSHTEGVMLPTGALSAWHPADSTGRIPEHTYIVTSGDWNDAVDWTFKGAKPMQPDTFDRHFIEALSVLGKHERRYVLDRSAGADSAYALRLRIVGSHALGMLFADTMCRPRTGGISILGNDPFILLVLPNDKARDPAMFLAMDLERRVGIIRGTRYLGCIKKLIFTVMNGLLPDYGILPLHCAGSEGKDGTTALFLGLSGTGKTTLSADPDRFLIGDDEHAWSDHGIANFEFGCYAKLAHLQKEKEPEIHEALFGKGSEGCIIENTMMLPDGTILFDDLRLTENSRGAYPLSRVPRVKEGATGTHPKTILFLTADASGVLPPVAKLSPAQAGLWFLLGYTSKLAGTELGVKEPKTTFSRFFGGPFMPCHPRKYITLFLEKIARHKTDVFLVNTGWSGGPYGVGKRMDISLTRSIVTDVLSGTLNNTNMKKDPLFHFHFPAHLDPRSTWADGAVYDRAAKELATKFAQSFDTLFGSLDIPADVKAACPGK